MLRNSAKRNAISVRLHRDLVQISPLPNANGPASYKHTEFNSKRIVKSFDYFVK